MFVFIIIMFLFGECFCFGAHIKSCNTSLLLLELDTKFTSSNFIILELENSSLKFWIALGVCLCIVIYLCGIMLTVLRFNDIKYGW